MEFESAVCNLPHTGSAVPVRTRPYPSLHVRTGPYRSVPVLVLVLVFVLKDLDFCTPDDSPQPILNLDPSDKSPKN